MLRLPSHLGLRELPQLLQSLVGDDMEPRASRVEIGFDRLERVHTEGVACLFNLVRWLESKGVDCVIRLPKEPRLWGSEYLDQMGFFELTTGAKLDPANTPRPTTLPLEFVQNDMSEQWVRWRLPRWLGGCLGTPPEELESLRIGVGEVFNNVQDHSGQPGGCAIAQHFQRDNRVRIAISDIGVGIPANVRQRVSHLSDEAALERAVEHGFSTQSIPGNRGAGLHTLLQQVVAEKSGEVSILSGKGRLDAIPVSGRVQVRTRSLGGAYPGTLLLLVLPTDTLPEPVEEGELTWS